MSYGKILVIEDDPDQARISSFALKDANYEVVLADTGSKGLKKAWEERPDLVILDINLPEMDGLTVCRQIRKKDDQLPIIFLSGKRADLDKIVGLEVGGDDYLTKPFNPLELVARVRALLRRTKRESSPKSEAAMFGNLRIDYAAHEISINDSNVDLTPIEFSLLSLFTQNPKRVFEREHIIEKVWGHDYVGDGRTVDTHVRNLRKKIKDAKIEIVAVRGVGYKLDL